MPRLSVQQLFEDRREKLQLAWIGGQKGASSGHRWGFSSQKVTGTGFAESGPFPSGGRLPDPGTRPVFVRYSVAMAQDETRATSVALPS